MEAVKALLVALEAFKASRDASVLPMPCHELIDRVYAQLVTLETENRLLCEQRRTLEAQVMALVCLPEVVVGFHPAWDEEETLSDFNDETNWLGDMAEKELMMEESAWQTQCPHCRFSYQILYNPIEAEIVQAIVAVERRSGKATTRAIAMQVMLSEAQTYRYLSRLEHLGQVQRIGVKGGWKVAA